ncbi:hypothetical protein [Nocardia camponoti]|uniref:Uncharacterized protein n=1 Tax=Nocardia camponoti TaxID=1616106 RepID=A0A917V8D5_9NOCA|nr:hypothetical protein [Nocardia camponoti]GGK51094.1 hypothetical protein GCM10011591_23330 [Nocardia camponoti]
MSDQLSPAERAALLALLVEAREMTNADLFAVAGVTLTGKSRVKLNEAGFVATEKVGRALVHELTDRGAQWCAAELSTPRPAKSGSYGGALYAVLAGLHRYLEATDQVLTDIFQPDIAGEILRTYRELTDGKPEQVRLAALRGQLAHVPADDFTKAMHLLAGRPGIHVRAEADRKTLTSDDHEAAIVLGETPRHLLTVEAGR